MQQNMRLRHAFYASLMALGYAGSASATDIAVCTDLGNFTIETLDQQSPAHTANFLAYVDRGYYMGTVFHRVIGGFMVQGGGYTREFRSKTTSGPVMNESKNGIGNSRGTVAAARTGDPHSATSQFFVNLENNPPLNASGDEWGYSVFGQVTQGMEVVDAIAALPTGPDGPFPTDVTDPLVAITSMARVVEESYPTLSADERHAALQQDIETAVAAGDNDEAADLFGAYRAACGELGPELLFTEATVLAAVGRNAAAVETLGEYLRVADNTSETYLEALSLSRTLAPGAVNESLADQRRLAELAEDCVFPTQPTIPDANDAVMEDMVTTQGSVVAYLEASNELLECLEELAEDDNLDEEEQALTVTAYNLEVDAQETLAEEWNTQRQLFLSLQ